METVFTVASLAIKAVNLYFQEKKEEALEKIIAQNEKIIQFKKYEFINRKLEVLRNGERILQDAIYSQNTSEKRHLLDSAFMEFTTLANFPLNEQLPDGELFDNIDFISKGYWGRFYIFGLLNEYRNSTIQVYTCASIFPEKAVELFDNKFFPKLDFSSLSTLCDNLKKIKQYEPLNGIYSNIPSNMAKALIELQMDKYTDKFKEILYQLKSQNDG